MKKKKKTKSEKRKKIIQLESLLKALQAANPTDRKVLLNLLDDKHVGLLCECVHNFVFKDLRLEQCIKAKWQREFKSEEKDLKKLTHKTTSIKSKKRILNQQGGFISALLSVAIPLIAELIYGSVKKK